jgi:hypothetical protein
MNKLRFREVKMEVRLGFKGRSVSEYMLGRVKPPVHQWSSALEETEFQGTTSSPGIGIGPEGLETRPFQVLPSLAL